MISSQGRVKQEFLTNTVSVKEYAYREDTNFPIRGQMEDGTNIIMIKVIFMLMTFWTITKVESLQSLMAMEELRWWSM